MLEEITAQLLIPCIIHACRDGLIAVNYAARAAGISRHMNAFQAREQCSEIQLVHVETIGKLYFLIFIF